MVLAASALKVNIPVLALSDDVISGLYFLPAPVYDIHLILCQVGFDLYNPQFSGMDFIKVK